MAKKINRRELRNPKTATVDFYINTPRFRIKRATQHAEKNVQPPIIPQDGMQICHFLRKKSRPITFSSLNRRIAEVM
ncbi:MAG: hypothetical protein NC216_01190 [Bacteroides sp.]|nr:hypothetical protein [Bacteroides sp.]